MEFPNLGEYHDNLSLAEAIRIYQEIPVERMNGIKGIGFELKDGSCLLYTSEGLTSEDFL